MNKELVSTISLVDINENLKKIINKEYIIDLLIEDIGKFGINFKTDGTQ